MSVNRGAPDRGITCRLERSDGSAWRVTRLELDRDPPLVTAFRSDPTGGFERRPVRLEEEPLSRGDRLVWLDRAGVVVWAFRSPL